ncbi:MAG: 50S ribosomal protein L18 [Gammaproteobacteria bacterium GWE2_42_36]|nr:MAG: 50S ribosomal protein L18 [Gammaproteobacteria bacterium GWE2_42_36]HCU05594.1 50S ribosomal protein L18 [Coxiellaceae bacterium]
MNKKVARLKRARRGRENIKRLAVPRLCVYRTLQYIYVQLFAAEGGHVLASASSAEKAFKAGEALTPIKQAEKIGATIAEKALALGIKKIAFDRSGYKYHGRVKALADGARSAGLEF